MSLSQPLRCVSNPRLKPWLVAVIIIVVLAVPRCAEILAAHADVMATLTLLLGGGTAAAYHGHHRHAEFPQTAK